MIIIDKCFLQGKKKSRIRELAASEGLVMSDALFFELLTSGQPGRSHCFAKLPQTENPIVLVSHIGKLIRYEIDTHKPAGKPSSHREQVCFKLNSCLLEQNYELSLEDQYKVNEQIANIQHDVQSFVTQAKTVEFLFPNLLKGSQEQQKEARNIAEQEIADSNFVSKFYSILESPLGKQPPVNMINKYWAIYKWYQVKLLFAVDLYVRYQGVIPQTFSPAIYEKLEHDVLDAQVLMLGCLEGAFATCEKKLKQWWRLLCRDGMLYD